MRSSKFVALLLVWILAASCSGGSDNAASDGADPDNTSADAVAADGSAQASGNDAQDDASSRIPRLIVGEDIQPGLNIATELGTCYYARLATVDGTSENAIAQANALGAQVFVQIEESDAAMLSNACGEWRVATDDDLQPTPDGGIPDNGMWLIPEHISPGTYQTVDSNLEVGCFYEILSDVSASLGAVIETQQGLDGQVTMTIPPEARAIRAYRCGAWTKTG